MRLIDVDALKRFIQENGMVYANTLDKFPVVDAEEVVRCKDCKHCELMEYTFYCHYWSRNTDENGYCYEGF